MIEFDIIVADPPWAFGDRLEMSDVKRGAEANYPTMSLTDIARLPMPAARDSLLALWCPSTLLFSHGGPTLDAWGFEYKGLWVWGKVAKSLNFLAFGMGHTFRQAHEVALIGVKGKPLKHLVNKSQRSLYVEIVDGDGPGSLQPNERHSQKPEHLQDSLDLMWPEANKLEIFARRERDGWVCLGNAVTGRDIQEDLTYLGG